LNPAKEEQAILEVAAAAASRALAAILIPLAAVELQFLNCPAVRISSLHETLSFEFPWRFRLDSIRLSRLLFSYSSSDWFSGGPRVTGTCRQVPQAFGKDY